MIFFQKLFFSLKNEILQISLLQEQKFFFVVLKPI